MSRITHNRGAALPEVGRISIGEKRLSKSGAEYPASLDYFKADGKYAAMFHSVVGEKPTTIKVAFVSDDLSQVCNERYECWERTRNSKIERGFKYGSGDGNTFEVWDDDSRKYVTKNADEVRAMGWKWQTILTLRFACLDVKGVMGVWKFTTRASQSTIPQIVSSFDWVKEKAGTIIGLPFDLIVAKHTSKTPGEAKNYPVVTLVPNFTEDSIEAVRAFVESGGNPMKMGVLKIDESKVKRLEP